ncbi:MAG: Mismatch repair protein msh3 [Chrysothrix sp. TS-e1954]|nr:MAG: Mismatch repair protein msh3 [Chrysothrix sp. TS-e1954]
MPLGRAPSQQESSQRNQRSISSFFSSKAASQPTSFTSPKAIPTLQPSRSSVERSADDALLEAGTDDGEDLSERNRRSSSKRPLQDISNGRQTVIPSPKRQRRSASPSDGTQSICNGSNLNGTQAANGVSSHDGSDATTPSAGGRASRYLFSDVAKSSHADTDDDAETRKEKHVLHQRFVKKLGRPDSLAEIRRKNHVLEDNAPDAGEDEDEEEAEDEVAVPKAAKGSKFGSVKKTAAKLTPMERQVIDIKRKNMETLLVVEVGYKYRFFGEDARIAAKELSIVCIPGKMRFDEHPSEAHLDRFASASIPTHRLHVHVKRLVAAGHKVGVVRQLETAALKAAGDNRNAPFVRKLTNLYTKGTYVDEVEGLEASIAGPSGGAPATGHLLCITETNAKGWGTDEKVQVGIIAVQPTTGDIIYDDFEDGFMRSEIETRLLHIAPCEFLIVGDLSRATEKLIQHLSGSKTNVFGDKARVERIERSKTAAAQAYGQISTFYADKLKSSKASEADADSNAILDKVHQLSQHVTICLSAMIFHLQEYGLEHVFDLTKNFQAFGARSHMALNGNTLNSLEIYRNQTDSGEHGSLFWVLDQTQTRYGQRLLRKWVGRPLLDQVRLQERVDAVDELTRSDRVGAADRLRGLLSKTKSDLEKSLIRIYYRKCTRPELLNVLQTLQRIATAYAHVRSSTEAGFDSELLNDAVAKLPAILEDVVEYLEQISTDAAKTDDKYNFFRTEHETCRIAEQKASITEVEAQLDAHRSDAGEKLRSLRKTVDYVTVAGIDFLIEVDNTQIKNVPASWAKISGTKKVSRFHTPEVIRMIRDRDQHQEALAAACDEAFTNLLTGISVKYQSFRDCIHSLATLDCLLSLASVASRPGYCKPAFSSSPCIHVKGGRHPMIEQLLLNTYVPNDVSLASDATRALLITGPNMGGKSSYVRQVALISIMAQIGSYVPAESAELGLLDAVYTRMGAFDNLMKGESTFMVELGESSDILKQTSERSLIILDELGRGTSTHDGVAIAHAVLDYIVRQKKSLLLFITHYQSLSTVADAFAERRELRNMHMSFSESTSGDEALHDQEITFLYTLAPGVAHRSYGLNVAKLANLPDEVIRTAGEKSSELEIEVRGAKIGSSAYLLRKALMQDDGQENMEDLIGRIEEL